MAVGRELSEVPTAMHSALEVHETLSSSPSAVPSTCWIDHRMPSQRSTSGNPPLTCTPMGSICFVANVPPAVQAVLDTHDTPSRPLRLEPVGVAIVSLDHPRPFQRSTSGTQAS